MKKYPVGYLVSALYIYACVNFWFYHVIDGLYYGRIDMYVIDGSYAQWALVLFTVVYTLGLLFFAIAPALHAGNSNVWRLVAFMGAMYAGILYMGHTAWEILLGGQWSWFVMPVELFWMVCITSLSAVLGYICSRFFS